MCLQDAAGDLTEANFGSDDETMGRLEDMGVPDGGLVGDDVARQKKVSTAITFDLSKQHAMCAAITFDLSKQHIMCAAMTCDSTKAAQLLCCHDL